MCVVAGSHRSLSVLQGCTLRMSNDKHTHPEESLAKTPPFLNEEGGKVLGFQAAVDNVRNIS